MTSRRPDLRRVPHVLRRSARGLVDPAYRRAIRARSLTRSLVKLSGDVRYIGVVDDGGVTFLHASDSVITPWIVATGEFQRTDFLDAWRLARQLVPRPTGGVFVDVGANIGTTTLYALRTGDFASAVAVEPEPGNLEVIHLNLRENRYDDRAVVVAAACGDEEGHVDLWVTPGNQGDHRVARADDQPDTHRGSVRVPVLPLDLVMSRASIRPSDIGFVWIDTQGHEPAVLSGASEVLASGAPFCIEVWPAEYRKGGRLEHFAAALRASFVRFVDLNEPRRPVRPIADLDALISRLGDSGQTDVLLIPKERS